MSVSFSPYRQARERLVSAYLNGHLGHGNLGPCAVTVLLGGGTDWLLTIDPLKGTIDHRSKLQAPRAFARGLRQIERAGFQVQEVLHLEAWYAGRLPNAWGLWLSTYDDDTDPGGTLGLHRVLTGLRSWEENRLAMEAVPKKPYLYRAKSQHMAPSEVNGA